ncbi:hypothetical protein AB0D94_08300 [Streptomyces sp. NPDC048255]|uniref:hypothetical protein n=1 Tax=Streptomyces sp. NPDC048255 TaxID=3154713 RepID=UPI0033E5CA8D
MTPHAAIAAAPSHLARRRHETETAHVPPLLTSPASPATPQDLEVPLMFRP